MWIKLNKGRDFYLFEKRPPPDRTFELFQQVVAANEMKARQEAREISKRTLQMANFSLEHEATVKRIKALTPEQADDILRKVDEKSLPRRAPKPQGPAHMGFHPKTMTNWLVNHDHKSGSCMQGICSCTSSYSPCTTSCLTSPCSACKPTEFWRVIEDD